MKQLVPFLLSDRSPPSKVLNPLAEAAVRAPQMPLL